MDPGVLVSWPPPSLIGGICLYGRSHWLLVHLPVDQLIFRQVYRPVLMLFPIFLMQSAV
jgi:hypothetical protein